ncbi:hypothetical protein CVT24_007152 [Panaeolus cyanescens]|uniref:Uncharacterized protein n=1 Tax=Panaeolus cyanescens TaxID=181874 RepID=A0A409YPH5_9AGAR|nr:hypothetical protein CVT24_007152 [Panaeolus cyanescens]
MKHSKLNSKASTASPVESQDTASSSKLTSSDKLTALPEVVGNMSLNPVSGVAARLARSSSFAMNSVKRSYRHSLDASSSLPSFAVTHPEQEKSQGQSVPIPRETNRPPNLNRLTPDNASTPRQRLMSIESDRHSAPNVGGNKQSEYSRIRSLLSTRSNLPPSIDFSADRITRASDSIISNPRTRPKTFMGHARDADTSKSQALNSRSQSPPRSRASSPFHFLHQLSSGFHRSHRPVAPEEPFIPINPYKINFSLPCCASSSPGDLENGGSSATSQAYECNDLMPQAVEPVKSTLKDALKFFGDTLPRQLYLNILLRLPAMYFSRVARVFEDAEVSKPDILRMMNAGYGSSRMANAAAPPNQQALGVSGQSSPAPLLPDNVNSTSNQRYPPTINALGMAAQVAAAPAGSVIFTPLPFPDEWTPGTVSPALIRFKHSWEAFIDSLLKEWKTLNVVSALLASAILTIFQIPEAADDPVTRTLALLSLVCALMSLSYGCMYIVRFGTMRSMFHASRWAEEAQKTKTSILWNAWVLLATPAVWMSWAMLLFISAILSFVWRTGSELDPEDRPPLSAKLALIPRIIISTILLIGLIYIIAIVRTLKKYGSHQGSTEALLRESGIRRQFEQHESHAHSPEFMPPNVNLDSRDYTSAGRKNGLRGGDGVEPERRGRALHRAVSPMPRRREEPNASQEKMSASEKSWTEHMRMHGNPPVPQRPLGLPSTAKPSLRSSAAVDRFEGLPLH